MSRFLIIPNLSDISASLALCSEYNLAFEYNDFMFPQILDDSGKLAGIIAEYKKHDLPCHCTTHGDFFDVLIFSEDRLIREIADKRIRQSIETARAVGAEAVIFHTNHEPALTAKSYIENWLSRNSEYWSGILDEYGDMNIYIENMFDSSPEMLLSLSERLCAHKNYGVCFDYAHASSFGGNVDISEWASALAPYVKHLHINDNDLKNDLHLPVGSGKIDWSIFKEYHDKYFSECSVLIEVTGTENQRVSAKFLEELGLIERRTK